MKKLLYSLATGLLLCSGLHMAQAQTTPKLITTVEGIKEYELKNGLRILLMPDASSNNLVVNIVYKVGSRHEGYGEKGMAHLLEHMLFKQSGKFVDIKKAIADKGAFANGTTWYDRTNYYEILSASDENLKWALDMEADRMINSKILPEELAKEFSVVRNEFEIGENDPSSVLQERILSSMYLWHNYGSSTIGSKEDIERVNSESLRTFYKKYYQPDNAVLIIAGKFDETKALDYTQKFFEAIPKPARVISQTYTVEPSQDGERFVELRRTGDIQYVAMGYHTPSFADKDYAANDALIEILTNDPSGVLYKKLIDTKLASKVYGYQMSLHDPGFTYFQCEVPKDKSLDAAKKVLFQTADDIAQLNITQEDLDRAKTKLLKDFENQSNNTVNFGISLTEIIGAGDWRLMFKYRDRVEALTLADINSVAKKYYKPSNRTSGVFIPDSNPDRTVVSETPDIDALLKDYKGKAVAEQKASFEASVDNIKKNVHYGTLKNGAKYAILNKPTKGDKINASIVLRNGNETNLNGKAKIAEITARMLKTGTTNLSKKEIADQLDKIKTDINFYGSADKLFVSISTDKPNLKAALDMLGKLLHQPSFSATEFDKTIIDARADYEAYKNDPSQIANNTLAKKTSKYPKGHPFYASDIDEDLASFSQMKIDDVKQYYQGFYGADHAVASFVGDVDDKLITDFLKENFETWNSKADYKEIERKYFDVPAATEYINTPDKTNAALAGSINLNISEKNADYPAVYMANELLGGGAFLSSRIPQRLREAEGMSYGAGSYMYASYDYNVGGWGLYAFFNPLYKDRINKAMGEEIDKAIGKGFSTEELSKSVDSWMQQNKTQLGMNGYIASVLRNYMEDNRDLNDITVLENKVKGLDVKTVNAALNKYFDKSKLVLIYAGDFNSKQ
jgi:zinc protease